MGTDITFVVGIASLVASIFSIALAGFAIWFTYHISQSTGKLLTEVDKKATVVEEVAKASQEKLLDTVTSIAAPQRPTQEEQLMAHAFSSPEMIRMMLEIANQQGFFTQGESKDPRSG